jgi:hypothetical protein
VLIRDQSRVASALSGTQNCTVPASAIERRVDRGLAGRGAQGGVERDRERLDERLRVLRPRLGAVDSAVPDDLARLERRRVQ